MSEDTEDIRQLATERLAYAAILHMQLRRRDAHGATPWRDARQGQGRVLALLKMKPEITQRELTFLMGMSRQSLAELLAKLEKQHLIEREASATDRRVVVVRLTKAGQDAEQTPDTSGDDILDPLTDDEVAQLSDYLGRIIAQLESQLGPDIDQRRQALWQMAREGDMRGFPGPFDPRLVGGMDPRLVNGMDPRLIDGHDPRRAGFRHGHGPAERRADPRFGGRPAPMMPDAPNPPMPPFGAPEPPFGAPVPPFGPVPPVPPTPPRPPMPPEPPFGPAATFPEN